MSRRYRIPAVLGGLVALLVVIVVLATRPNAPLLPHQQGCHRLPRAASAFCVSGPPIYLHPVHVMASHGRRPIFADAPVSGGGVVTPTLTNSGNGFQLGGTATPASIAAGQPTTFTIAIANNTSSPLGDPVAGTYGHILLQWGKDSKDFYVQVPANTEYVYQYVYYAAPDATPGTVGVTTGIYAPSYAAAYLYVQTLFSFTIGSPLPTPTAVTVPAVTPSPTPPGISPAIMGLHVIGSNIVNGSNQVVTLHGVNRDGTEYMCMPSAGLGHTFDGPADQASIDAMKQWHINAVRVPLNEGCWLGVEGMPSGQTAAQYRTTIMTYTAMLQQNGLIPIIDLHEVTPTYCTTNPNDANCQGVRPADDAQYSPSFWSSVAAAYAGNTGVILELINEPHADSDGDTTAAWACWQSGGTCAGVPWTAAGVQATLNAVRLAGNTNVVLLDGIQFAHTFDRLRAYLPNDPVHELAASWHVYSNDIGAGCDATCLAPYKTIIGQVIPTLPLVATEIGQGDCKSDFLIPFMNALDDKGIGYLAWAWDTYDCSGFPSIISDYTGSPTTFGRGYQAHLSKLVGLPPFPTSTPGPVSPPATTHFPWGIAVGATQPYTSLTGVPYVADTGQYRVALAATTPYTTADWVSGTADQQLYDHGVYSQRVRYDIPLPNGYYDVTYRWALTSDNHYGNKGLASNINNNQALDCAFPPDQNNTCNASVTQDLAAAVTVPATVTQHLLSVDVFANYGLNAVLSGIEVDKSSTVGPPVCTGPGCGSHPVVGR